jgi:serine phosphatase RsbU (regulator of sigma subunit)
VPDVYLIAGFAYLIAGSHYIGILSHWRGMVLRKAKTAIENQNTELNQQKNDIELQKSLLERHNQVIQSINQSLQDSIEYAQQIQTSLLPLATDLAQSFKQHFVLFMPRDMVSGDFYFLDKDAQSTLIAAIDCVGHGIPGAFLSLLTHQMLQNIVSKGIRSPEVVLEHLHQGIRQTLQQAVNQNRDGLDAAICLIEPDKKLLSFAGAKNPLYYFENNILHIVEANRKSIGGEQDSESHAFDKHLIQLADNKKQVFYLFTDGYADQFGGEENKKLGKRKFKQLLADLQHLPLNNQKDALVQYLREWTKKGKEDQIDDILLIGFEVL